MKQKIRKNSQSNGTNSSNSLKSSTGSLTKTSDTIVDKSASNSFFFS